MIYSWEDSLVKTIQLHVLRHGVLKAKKEFFGGKSLILLRFKGTSSSRSYKTALDLADSSIIFIY